ncbi:hypothetical protein EVAR_17739_1 [Eumeta japonica]|uniref:Uncharacterized protein n=1 Tax=Eumeta variegata TaxID=151549 RepID=A0A4C1TT95_EUMVA|nr:hypothetical protein EVAR_17739_1 [Eumeta japonica]
MTRVGFFAIDAPPYVRKRSAARVSNVDVFASVCPRRPLPLVGRKIDDRRRDFTLNTTRNSVFISFDNKFENNAKNSVNPPMDLSGDRRYFRIFSY